MALGRLILLSDYELEHIHETMHARQRIDLFQKEKVTLKIDANFSKKYLYLADFAFEWRYPPKNPLFSAVL